MEQFQQSDGIVSVKNLHQSRTYSMINFRVLYITIIIGLLPIVGFSQDVSLSSQGFRTKIQENTLRYMLTLEGDDTVRYSLFEYAAIKDGKQSKLTFLGCENSSITPSQKYLGIRRGIHIWSVQVSKKDIRAMLACAAPTFTVDYGVALSGVFPNPLSRQEKTHFDDLVNKDHVPYILRSTKDIPKSLLNEQKWLHSDSQYVKVSTKKDGVAFVTGNQLLQIQPSWEGVSLSGLHLMSDGKPYPYSEINDNRDNKLDNNDTLAFIGQRTVGDSTWHDLVTDERVFFFTKNSSFTSLRYSWSDETQYDAILESVEQEYHLEKNNWFHYGDIDGYFGNWFTELRFGKGFYWKEESIDQPWDLLNGLQKPLFTHCVLPAVKGSGEIHSVSRLSVGDDRIVLDQLVQSTINGNIGAEIRQKNQGLTAITVNNPSLLMPGVNVFGLQAGVSTFRGLRLLVDYFHCKAQFAPEAINGVFHKAVITAEQKKYKMEVPGFKDKKVLLYDNINRTITQGSGKKGLKYSLSSQNENGYSSVCLQDSALYYGIQNGWVIAFAYPNGTFSIIQNDQDKAIAELNNLPTNTVIAFVCTGTDMLSSQMSKVLRENGLSINTQNNIAYTGIIQKGNSSSLKEVSDRIAITNGFLVSDEFNTYKTEFVIPNPQVLYAADIRSMEQAKIYSVSSNNLFSESQKAEVLIITHPMFTVQAQRLADFRKQQGHDIRVVSVEDIYNQFGYGKKSQHVIKSFLQYAYNTWKSPSLTKVLFFGNASWDPLKLLPTSTQTDYVPTYGVPVSDFWYGLVEGNDVQPEIIIGRLTPSSMKDAQNIVDKLIEYDTMAVQPWMKNFGSFSEQGIDEDFTFLFASVEDYVFLEPIGGNVVAHSTTSIQGRPQVLRDAINNGLLWLNYSGHGSTLYFGLDGWQAENLNNTSKYFFLGTHSCQTGAFADPVTETRNESYVNSEKKGAIAATGDSGWGYSNIAMEMMYNAYSGFARDSLRQLGDITYRAKLKFGGGYTFAALQYSLIGDPLTRLRLDIKPDLFIRKIDVNIRNENDATEIAEDDSLAKVTVVVHNAGIVPPKSAKIRLIRTYNVISDTLFAEIPQVWSNQKVEFLLSVKNMPGNHTYSIAVNYDKSISENVYQNNSISDNFTVFSQNALAFDPQQFWSVNADRPEFRVLARVNNSDTQFEMKIHDGKNILMADTILSYSVFSISGKSLYVDWNPALKLQVDSVYYFSFRNINNVTKKNSAWTQLPCVARKNIDNVEWFIDAERSSLMQLNNLIKVTSQRTSLTLNEERSTWKIASCGQGSGFRYGQIFINGEGTVSKPDQVQCVVVHKSKYSNDIRQRIFETYNSSLDVKVPNTRNFYRYIMDSIPNGDIVGVTFANSGFRGFYFIHDLGLSNEISLDSLREALQSIGSVLIDSTLSAKYYPNGELFPDNVRWTSSFAIIGEKGAATAFDEIYGAPKDTIYAQSNNIPTFSKNGSLLTSTIGESQQWDSLLIRGENLTNQCVVHIYGFSTNNVPLGIIKTDSTYAISLRDINASLIPEIRVGIELQRKLDSNPPQIYDISTTFIPIPELAIIPASLRLSQDSVLRGDTLTVFTDVVNLSKRVSSDSSEIRTLFIPKSSNGILTQTTQIIPGLRTDEVYSSSLQTETSNFGTVTSVEASVRQKYIHEFSYTFNNKYETSVKVGEDIVPPTIEVFADSMKVNDGDYVLPNPYLAFVVSDNSLLKIDSSRILIRINGRLFPFTNKAENARYIHHYGEGTKRGTFSFRVKDFLGLGDNNMRVIVEDASANKDTLSMKLWVASENSVNNVKPYPNPSTGAISLDFTLRTQEVAIPFIMTIYDAQGRVIRRVADIGNLGDNTLYYDGKDEQYNDIPSGVYSFSIQFYGMYYTEPINGGFVIIR